MRPMMMTAREYFEDVRRYAQRLEALNNTYAHLVSATLPKGMDYSREQIDGTGAQDAMKPVDKLLDFSDVLPAQRAECYEVINEAMAYLYGQDGKGGLYALKGSRYADPLCMYYCQLETWSEISAVMGFSPKWPMRLRDRAFAYIDQVGWAALREAGEGQIFLSCTVH